jgi:hypothetical protein
MRQALDATTLRENVWDMHRSGSDNTSANGSADDRCADSGSDNTSANGSADDRCADSGVYLP